MTRPVPHCILVVANETLGGRALIDAVKRRAEEAHERGEKIETKDATIPVQTTPPQIAAWQRRQRIAQIAVPVLAGANIALGSYLVQSYRTGASVTQKARRLLPV